MGDGVERQTPGWAWLAVLGGGVMAAGTVLPWITATAGFVSITRTGLEIATLDAVLVLVAGCACVLAGIGAITGAAATGLISRSPILLGLVGVGIGIYDATQVADRVRAVEGSSSLATASMGSGLYLVFVGGGLAILAGLQRQNESTASPAVRWGSERPCPACRQRIPRASQQCPHCRTESQPWIFHEGRWWIYDKVGKPFWLDERRNAWVPAESDSD